LDGARYAGTQRPLSIAARTVLSILYEREAEVLDARPGAVLVASPFFPGGGGQLADRGALRVNFDLPDTDNDRLRAFDGPVNAAIREDRAVRARWLPWATAKATPGMFCSKLVTPPQEDGMVCTVEIVDLDRQAWGGTHLASTGRARPVRILKVESKGRHNHRVRVGVVGA
jgi:misacylated tRNA(Ala) deacylase